MRFSINICSNVIIFLNPIDSQIKIQLFSKRLTFSKYLSIHTSQLNQKQLKLSRG